jgi:hypothetical protein
MTGNKQRRRGWCAKCKTTPLKKRGLGKLCEKCQHEKKYGKKKKKKELKRLLS